MRPFGTTLCSLAVSLLVAAPALATPRNPQVRVSPSPSSTRRGGGWRTCSG